MTKFDIATRIMVYYGEKLLLVSRSSTSSRAGEYELPGGMLDPDENLEEGALRELKEETGLIPDSIEFVSSAHYVVGGEPRISAMFRCKIGVRDVELSDEHDAFEWVDGSSWQKLQTDDYYTKLLEGLYPNRSEPDNINDNLNHSELHIYTDGGSRGNPGPSATGYVIMTKEEEVLESGGTYLGITTNNQAEYRAVLEALEVALKYKPEHISFFLDSMLAVNQLNGKWKMKNEELKPIHTAILALKQDFNSVSFTHVRRAFNALSDAEVNKVLDQQE